MVVVVEVVLEVVELLEVLDVVVVVLVSGIVVSGTVLVVVVDVTGSRVNAVAGTISQSSPRFQ